MLSNRRIIHEGHRVDRLMRRSAVGYIRVSTEEQSREGVSLAAQEQRLRAYATLCSLDLVEVVRDEGVSAGHALSTRAGGCRLLELLHTGQAHNVVALKLDRLFRDAVDCLQSVREWDRTEVALHLVDLGGQTVNTASASGRFMLTVLAGAAEMERNLIRERTSQAMRFKRDRGDRLGATPLGFRTPTPGSPMEPVAVEIETVNCMLELRGRGLTFRAVADELSRRALPTKRGGQWRASTVRALWLARARYSQFSAPA